MFRILIGKNSIKLSIRDILLWLRGLRTGVANSCGASHNCGVGSILAQELPCSVGVAKQTKTNNTFTKCIWTRHSKSKYYCLAM